MVEIKKLPRCEECKKNAKVVIGKDNLVSIVCSVNKEHRTDKFETYREAYGQWDGTYGKEKE